MALPKELFVRLDVPENNDACAWFVAADTLEKAMEGEDGPEEIGIYQLVEIRTMQKILTALPPERKARR